MQPTLSEELEEQSKFAVSKEGFIGQPLRVRICIPEGPINPGKYLT